MRHDQMRPDHMGYDQTRHYQMGHDQLDLIK